MWYNRSMIPPELREELNRDPFYKRCCLTGRTDGKIDWHHNMLWKGKSLQKKFAILPVHISIHQYHKGLTSEVKEKLNWIMVNRMTPEELDYYSKVVSYTALKKRLNEKYAVSSIK